jgi:hypothetical protein
MHAPALPPLQAHKSLRTNNMLCLYGRRRNEKEKEKRERKKEKEDIRELKPILLTTLDIALLDHIMKQTRKRTQQRMLFSKLSSYVAHYTLSSPLSPSPFFWRLQITICEDKCQICRCTTLSFDQLKNGT